MIVAGAELFTGNNLTGMALVPVEKPLHSYTGLELRSFLIGNLRPVTIVNVIGGLVLVCAA